MSLSDRHFVQAAVPAGLASATGMCVAAVSAMALLALWLFLAVVFRKFF